MVGKVKRHDGVKVVVEFSVAEWRELEGVLGGVKFRSGAVAGKVGNRGYGYCVVVKCLRCMRVPLTVGSMIRWAGLAGLVLPYKVVRSGVFSMMVRYPEVFEEAGRVGSGEVLWRLKEGWMGVELPPGYVDPMEHGGGA